MPSFRTLAAVLVSMAPVASIPGCSTSSENTCAPGDLVACTCDDGSPGYSECSADGSAYGACGSCGTTPSTTSSSSGGGAGGGGALLPFLSPCGSDAECETGLCFQFTSKGKFCTHSCQGPQDCEPPSPGCNGMGVCKP